MATTVSLINMKGGVGKTTLTFNLAWYCAWRTNLKVLAVDLDPQANLRGCLELFRISATFLP
jgi:chromosome partitioning protein